MGVLHKRSICSLLPSSGSGLSTDSHPHPHFLHPVTGLAILGLLDFIEEDFPFYCAQVTEVINMYK